MYSVQVGTLTLKAPLITERRYDYAAWWAKVELAPGEYPVIGTASTKDQAERGDFFNLRVQAEGIIVDDYFAPHFCGNRIPAEKSSWTKVGAKEPAGSIYIHRQLEGLTLADGWEWKADSKFSRLNWVG